jgi:TRAP-type C4-dicarboxylate transport system permease small subunit
MSAFILARFPENDTGGCMIKNFLKNIEENTMVVLLPFTCLLVAFSTLGRYTGLYNMYWAEEVIRYLYIWVAFLGISMGVKSDAHFRLQVFVNMLPEPPRTLLRAFSTLVVISFLGLLCYYSVLLLQRQISMEQTSPMLLIPMFIPYGAITVGSFTMCVRVILKVIDDFKHSDKAAAGGDEE